MRTMSLGGSVALIFATEWRSNRIPRPSHFCGSELLSIVSRAVLSAIVQSPLSLRIFGQPLPVFRSVSGCIGLRRLFMRVVAEDGGSIWLVRDDVERAPSGGRRRRPAVAGQPAG